MIDILTSLFNPYNRKARLQPALLILLPIFIILILLISEFQAIWAAIGGLVFYCGGTTLLTQIGRDRGKALEPMLFRSWGSKPSVAMMRHGDTRIPQSTKERYRDFLERMVPGLRLASPEDEQKCQTRADAGYESATSWLLARTRDRRRFGLIFQENINYGFRRNIWALKPWALAVDVIALAVVAFLKSESWTGEIATTLSNIDTWTWMCIASTSTHMLIFAFIIRPDWVRVPAEEYARQLLAACDMLESEQDS